MLTIRDLFRHFSGKSGSSHREKCCWTIDRIESEKVSFKTTWHKSSSFQFKLGSNFVGSDASITKEAVVVPDVEEEKTLQSQGTADASVSVSTEKKDVSVVTEKTVNSDHSTQSELSIKDAYVESSGLNLRPDFEMTDLKECFNQFPLLKSIMENSINRTNKHQRHDLKIKSFIVRHSLKHSTASALDISSAIGGPKKTMLKIACKSKIPILPYLDEDNLVKHMLAFRDMLVNKCGVPLTDIAKVPIQASIDATAVSGKLATKSLNPDDDNRVLYGVVPQNGPMQKTSISLLKKT